MFAMQDKILLLVPEPLREDTLRTFEKFQINTVPRCLHFLSQVMHESGNFARKEENLNYSAKRLMEVFDKYFKDMSKALTYERKREAIASYVYANRLGNGSEASREGWTYRGRGFIQLTGKDNYQKFSEFAGEDLVANPDLVASKYPMLSAGWFWNNKKLNEIADEGLTDDVIKKVRKKVNGGEIGLKEVTDMLNNLCEKIMVTR